MPASPVRHPVMEIVRVYRFQAARRLPKLPMRHPCARLHGHGFKVVLRLRGPVDADLGWVEDFALIDSHVRPLIEALDHRLLNDVEGLANPTCEAIALWLWRRLRGGLIRLSSVSVFESEDAGCVYHGEDESS